MPNLVRNAATPLAVALCLYSEVCLAAGPAPLQHLPATKWVEWLPDAATVKARGGDPQAIEERGRIQVEIGKPGKIAARSETCREVAASFESGWVESFPPALLYSGGRATYAFWREDTEPLEVTVRAIQAAFGTYESAPGAPPKKPLCLLGSNVGTAFGTPVEGLHFRDTDKHDHIVLFLLGAAGPELRKQLAGAPAYATSLPDPKALLVTLDAGVVFTPLEVATAATAPR